jgi:subtilisin family serine protease
VGQQNVAPSSTTYADNWGQQDVGASAAWQAGDYGAGVIVAVVDTGVDIYHDQLKKQIAVNSGETGVDANGNSKADNGIDDDGDGYIDNAFGYDFTVNAALTGDNSYHGTHVDGVIAAEHTDTVAAGSTHVEGLAPKAKILPLAFLDSSGSGIMSDGVRAIEYAVAQGAKVINASWGGPTCSRSLRDTITGLSARNVIFVAAAGNSGSNIDRYPEYPASLNLAAQLTVGATGDHGNMANYSNYGAAAVHLFAPGSSIISTLPGNVMGSLSGTSMATPFVSGAVALLLSAVPDSTPAQVRAALYNSATKRSDYLNSSKGRLNLASAISELHRITGR